MKKTKYKIEQIRAAINANCGGLQNATDDQLIRLWNVIDAETQGKYIANSKPATAGKTETETMNLKGKNHAVSDKNVQDLRGNTE